MPRQRAASVPFDQVCRAAGLPAPVAEYRFARAVGRDWRFDWAWPDYKVALEIDGGVWIKGRHVRPRGYLADMEKLNQAVAEGWAVVRGIPAACGRPRGRAHPSPLDVVRGEPLEIVRRVLLRRSAGLNGGGVHGW